MQPRRHMVLPDLQIKPGVNTDHLEWAGKYAVQKRPDVIVCLGDAADLPSLSTYDVGTASAEGRRFVDDVKAVRSGLKRFLNPIRRAKGYRPRLVMLKGNHDARADREAEQNPKLKGLISSDCLGYREDGWEVYPFLQVVKIDGVEFAHYFVSGSMGRPVSSAAALLRTRQCSAIQGHIQKIDIAIHNNTQHIALLAGIFYSHQEDYLTSQGNNTKRGLWMLNQVENGTFDPMFVSISYLKRRFS